MYTKIVNLEQALRLLRKYNYGIGVDAYDNVYLDPMIQNPVISDDGIDLISKAVDINNREVLIAGGMIEGIWEHVCKLDEKYKDEIERELGFKIQKGKCGIMLSQEELKRLGAAYKC